MPDKRLEARVDRLVARWKPRLCLSDWGITIQYEDKDLIKNEVKTLAQIVTNLQYTDARLIIYPVFFAERVRVQEAVIVHELSHIITQQTREALFKTLSGKKAAELNESLTEHISKMLFRAYKSKGSGYHL